MAAIFIQSLVSALIGSLIGYFAAVKGVQPANRPSLPAMLAIGTFAGAALCTGFEAALASADPAADLSKLQAPVGVVCGILVALFATRWKLSKSRS